ncbi:MAG: hypothetical protein V4623_09255 [Pseudomonadota bacterium]
MLKLFTPYFEHPLADGKDLKRALSELPSDNPLQAVDDLCAWLDAMEQIGGFRSEHYVRTIQKLDDAAQAPLQQLAKDYLHAQAEGGNPAAPQAQPGIQRWATISLLCWNKLAECYEYALERHQSAQKRAESLGALLPLVVFRLIQARAAQLKWIKYQHGPQHHPAWLSLGRAYLVAEAAACTQKSVVVAPQVVAHQPAQSTCNTVHLAYLHALVLHATALDSLTPSQIDLVERVLTCFLAHFTLSKTRQRDSLFAFVLSRGEHAPPIRLLEATELNGATEADAVRFVAAGSFPETLKMLLTRVERGEIPEQLNLGASYPVKTLLPVLRHLARYWAPQRLLRKYQRHSVKTKMAVLHGFPAAFSVCLGQVRQTDELDNLVREQAEQWRVDNVSLGGFSTQAEILRHDWLKLGALLSMQPSGGDNWLLGVVRRFNKPNEARAHIGVQTLAKQAQSIELCVAASGSSPSQRAMGIWLRDGNLPGEVRLVLPPSLFSLRHCLEFSHQNQAYRLFPVTLQERGDDYAIARYREQPLN